MPLSRYDLHASYIVGCAYNVIKALEENNRDRALEIARKNVDKLVDAEDTRDGRVEERFQYKYRRFKRKGLTLLHYAAFYDHANMVELLLQHNAGKLVIVGNIIIPW